MTTLAPVPEIVSTQRRVVGTLFTSQILGSVGMSAGIAVTSLLAEQVSGSAAWAGMGGTFQVLGSAFIAIPMVRLMARRGRRTGLVLGYTLAVLGAAGLVAAGTLDNFLLLLLASASLGGATAANNQARYAAVDLAQPAHRGRDLSTVVWATTVGAILGPNLTGPGEVVAGWFGLPVLAGPYLFSILGFVAAMVVLAVFLRPDPLLESRRLTALDAEPGDLAEPVHGSVVRGFRVVLGIPAALLGLLATSLGHAVMVMVMVMTPIHMHHGDASLRVIGMVLSGHIVGMFAFAPIVGRLVDRFGARKVALLGSAVLVTAGLLASSAPEGASTRITVGLFLLGLGWSCTLISGSTLLVSAVPLAERPGAQGASDLTMGLMAGGLGALSGVVVAQLGYPALALAAAVVAGLVVVASWALRERAGAPAG